MQILHKVDKTGQYTEYFGSTVHVDGLVHEPQAISIYSADYAPLRY